MPLGGSSSPDSNANPNPNPNPNANPNGTSLTPDSSPEVRRIIADTGLLMTLDLQRGRDSAAVIQGQLRSREAKAFMKQSFAAEVIQAGSRRKEDFEAINAMLTLTLTLILTLIGLRGHQRHAGGAG